MANEDDLEQVPAGRLRQMYEEAISQNRELAEKVTLYSAKEVLVEKGFDLVKPEDLKGVEPTKFEERAAELQKEREAQANDLLRAALLKRGVDESEVDSMLSALAGEQQAQTETAQAAARIGSVGRIEGNVEPLVNPNQLHGYDAILAGLAQKKQ